METFGSSIAIRLNEITWPIVITNRSNLSLFCYGFQRPDDRPRTQLLMLSYSSIDTLCAKPGKLPFWGGKVFRSEETARYQFSFWRCLHHEPAQSFGHRWNLRNLPPNLLSWLTVQMIALELSKTLVDVENFLSWTQSLIGNYYAACLCYCNTRSP